MRDRGSVGVVVLVASLAMMLATLMALGAAAETLVDHQRARTAADAAALAGVTGGRGASATVAAANGASLVSWSQRGHEVTVVVAVDDRTATARATDGPP